MEFTNRQIEIIASATNLIGEKGIQNLTIKNLAKEMGFSEPALYRHFSSKIEILESVLMFYRNQMSEGLQAVLGKKKSGLAKIEGLLQFQFEYFTKYPAIVMVIFAETSFQFDHNLSKTVLSIMNKKKSFVESILQQGQEDGSIRKDISPEQQALVIMGSMRFTVLRWRLSNYNENLVSEGNKLFDTIKLMLT